MLNKLFTKILAKIHSFFKIFIILAMKENEKKEGILWKINLLKYKIQ